MSEPAPITTRTEESPAADPSTGRRETPTPTTQLDIVFWLVAGAAVGWLAAAVLWVNRIARHCDDWRVVLTALLCVVASGLYGARRASQLWPRLIVGTTVGAFFGLWVIQTTATFHYRVEHLFSNPFFAFPASSETMCAVLGGMLAVALGGRRSPRQRAG
ncbi:hypothetical protein ACFL5Q_04100 [Planctomycetota bacterium]